jgi:CRP/FNR family transcriptional regulator, cyclic AMP receptor protein
MTDDFVKALGRVPLLSGLARHDLERLSRDFSERAFPAGSMVVKQGEARGIGFFVILEGEASIRVDGAEVGRLGPGDHFGELALISDRVRTASATAVTDLRCLVTTVWEFRGFVKGNAEVAWKLLEHVAQLLDETQQRAQAGAGAR